MTKAAGKWTEERLDDLAAVVEPVPLKLATLGATVEHLERVAGQIQPVPTQVAVLVATVDTLIQENRILRAELAGLQREIVQLSWALVVAVVGAGAAIIGALI
jgi:hypothetical protein